MTIIATMLQKPLLILRRNTLSPVPKQRASNMYQKWVHTKMEKQQRRLVGVIGESAPTCAWNICGIEVTSAWLKSQ